MQIHTFTRQTGAALINFSTVATVLRARRVTNDGELTGESVTDIHPEMYLGTGSGVAVNREKKGGG